MCPYTFEKDLSSKHPPCLRKPDVPGGGHENERSVESRGRTCHWFWRMRCGEVVKSSGGGAVHYLILIGPACLDSK